MVRILSRLISRRVLWVQVGLPSRTQSFMTQTDEIKIQFGLDRRLCLFLGSKVHMRFGFFFSFFIFLSFFGAEELITKGLFECKL